MQYNQYKTYDLTKKRPNVLILGNGLTRETSLSWAKLIKSIGRTGANISQYEEQNPDGSFKRFIIPNTILTVATSIINDSARRKKYSKIFDCDTYPPNAYLKQLLSLPFDAILTTNYSYELESEIEPKYPCFSQDKKLDFVSISGRKTDPVYLLHTYNSLAKAPDIWHIHGELRRPSSIVLTHDEYARLVQKITEYNSARGRDYVNSKTNLKFLSWVDYFLLGNIYILGLSMDFSEFDLWWLLGRRLREKADKGSFIFYEGEKSSELAKQHALHDVGAQIETFHIKTDTSADYALFYQKAIDDIQSRLYSMK